MSAFWAPGKAGLSGTHMGLCNKATLSQILGHTRAAIPPQDSSLDGSQTLETSAAALTLQSGDSTNLQQLDRKSGGLASDCWKVNSTKTNDLAEN